MIQTAETGRAGASQSPIQGRTEFRSFFPIVSGVLLAGMVVAFAPTFFLRGRLPTPFPLPSMPAYLAIHGTVLTAWFSLVFVQTCLVAAHRTALHRRLGVVAVCVAGLLVQISAFVVVRAVPRLIALGAPRQALYGIILGDFLALSLFSVFVGTAVYLRRHRTDIHKRLMIAACFAIYGPVLSRLQSFYGLPVPFPVVVFVMLAGLAAYDLITLKRIHRATLLAFGGFVFLGAVGAVLIGTGVADALIEALR